MPSISELIHDAKSIMENIYAEYVYLINGGDCHDLNRHYRELEALVEVLGSKIIEGLDLPQEHRKDISASVGYSMVDYHHYDLCNRHGQSLDAWSRRDWDALPAAGDISEMEHEELLGSHDFVENRVTPDYQGRDYIQHDFIEGPRGFENQQHLSVADLLSNAKELLCITHHEKVLLASDPVLFKVGTDLDMEKRSWELCKLEETLGAKLLESRGKNLEYNQMGHWKTGRAMVNACYAELIDEQNNELICWQFRSWSKLHEMGKISDAEYKKLMKDTEDSPRPEPLERERTFLNAEEETQ